MDKQNNIVKEIDLGAYKNIRSSSFTGRPQGTAVRKEINLDSYDRDSTSTLKLIIPEGTTSFNPSFYLGLLFDSYKKLGSEGFKRKYIFQISSSDVETKRVLERNLQDGVRNAINALGGKNVLKEFINQH